MNRIKAFLARNQCLTNWLILLAGAAWIWLSAVHPGSTTNGSIPAPRAGFLAPDFSLRDQHGQIVTLSDLQGKAVVINIWASWCPPCRAEMPALQRVFQAYQSQGLIILGVNATDQDDVQSALALAQTFDLTFPILFDVDSNVYRIYQVSSLPTTFFINPLGIVDEVVIGGPMAEALLRSRVEKILADNATNTSISP